MLKLDFPKFKLTFARKKICTFLLSISAIVAIAAPSSTSFVILDHYITGAIDENAFEALKEKLAKDNGKSTHLYVNLDAVEGEVQFVDSISQLIYNCPLITIVHISPSALSSAVLIPISADSIYMTKGALFGAATLSYDDARENEKYESHFRAKLRAMAEAKGRNLEIIKAFTEASYVMEGLTDSKSVLELKAEQAKELNYCEAILPDLKAVKRRLGIEVAGEIVKTGQAKVKDVSIYQFEINQEIMPAAWKLTKTAIDSAEAMNADYILLRLNTYGGRVDIADSIASYIQAAGPIVLLHIDNNAASAGALISIACDSIYMTQSATMGAATVVDQSGTPVPDKYQSYMRAKFRSIAETAGRNPDIAEAFVDPDVQVEGIVDSGKVLTFTASEAVANGFCEGVASDLEEVLKMAGIESYTITKHEIRPIDKVINFLMNPILAGIFMMVIVGGIYFELQTPGVGFPIIAATIAAVLYFAPLYLEGMAENWEILVFIVGVLLIGLEIFVIPGFGIAGISGIVLVIAGLTLSLVQNVQFDFSFTGFDEISFALMRVMASVIAPIILLLVFGNTLLDSNLFKRMTLQGTQLATEGYTTAIFAKGEPMVGKTGAAVTRLSPSGKVSIDGEWYDAISEDVWIEKGEQIKVVGLKSSQLTVRKA